MSGMGRREFVALLGGAGVRVANRGSRAAGSYIGSRAASTTFAAVFRQGLSEADFSRADVACSAPFRRRKRSVARSA
jgi:hypothetical protein